MSEKFQNKYRIPSARLQNWNYGWDGAYFITICTKNRKHCLGNIVKTANLDVSMIHLSKTGKMVNKYWHEIPMHFPFVKLDAFVSMPNHIHGIIIDKTNFEFDNDAVETPNLGVSTRDKIAGVTINAKQTIAA